MPLSVPNLDDRTYDDLVQEALAMLPRYAPAWTNHNPSDPGITLIELLAYFTEHFIYRLNRVTRETKIRFLQLLSGSGNDDKSRWAELSTDEVEDELRRAVRDLRRKRRAVTAEDYEYLAREATAHNPSARRILRARPFVRLNLRAADAGMRDRDAPGHVSIVVVPGGELPRDAVDALVSQVRDYLEPRRLLATRLHVMAPFFLWVRIGARIYMRSDVAEELRINAPENALKKLGEYFGPFLGGGPQGEGWPFGRALYLSEVYEALEQVEGVDYIDDVNVVAISAREEGQGEQEEIDERDHIGVKVGRSVVGLDSRLGARPEHGKDRILRDTAGKLVGIALRPYELIRIASRAQDFVSGESSAPQGPSGEQNFEVSA